MNCRDCSSDHFISVLYYKSNELERKRGYFAASVLVQKYGAFCLGTERDSVK